MTAVQCKPACAPQVSDESYLSMEQEKGGERNNEGRGASLKRGVQRERIYLRRDYCGSQPGPLLRDDMMGNQRRSRHRTQTAPSLYERGWFHWAVNEFLRETDKLPTVG